MFNSPPPPLRLEHPITFRYRIISLNFSVVDDVVPWWSGCSHAGLVTFWCPNFFSQPIYCTVIVIIRETPHLRTFKRNLFFHFHLWPKWVFIERFTLMDNSQYRHNSSPAAATNNNGEVTRMDPPWKLLPKKRKRKSCGGGDGLPGKNGCSKRNGTR